MQNLRRLFFLSLSTIIALFLMSTTYAQPIRTMNCDDCYEEGYNDGYDDAYDDCPCPEFMTLQNLGRFYAGLALTYQSLLVLQNVRIDGESIGRLRSQFNGWLLSALFGYGMYFHRNFYLGGEIFFGGSNTDGTSSINSLGSWYDRKVSQNATYGFALLPGYLLYNALLYLRFGLNRTILNTKDVANGNVVTSINQTHWVNGFIFGLGLETPLYKSLTLRGELNHINYDSFTTGTGTNSRPSDNQATVGVNYHFNF